MSTHSSISCLENSMDRGGLRTIVHGVAKDSDMTELTHTRNQTFSHNMFFQTFLMETVLCPFLLLSQQGRSCLEP